MGQREDEYMRTGEQDYVFQSGNDSVSGACLMKFACLSPELKLTLLEEEEGTVMRQIPDILNAYGARPAHAGSHHCQPSANEYPCGESSVIQS